MKKNYIIPGMETMEFNLTSVLCASGDLEEGSGIGTEKNEFGAPGRKVF